jgi:7-carboxy-7-deazaguanine synthase
MKTYLVKECFRTIQGEGYHAGTPAVFLRLVGCNMWSGYEGDRALDSERNQAQCPLWCDTDFTPEGSQRYTAGEVRLLVAARCVSAPVSLIVITGGEPLLQVDDELLHALWSLDPTPMIAIETNGTVRPKFGPNWKSDGHDVMVGLKPWITLSPKQPRSMLQLPLELVSELKLVYPAYDPSDWEDVKCERFIQPAAWRSERTVAAEQDAAAFVIADGTWKLSLQTHKILGVP